LSGLTVRSFARSTLTGARSLQDKTAAFFDWLGLETRAAVARERGERARAMLELAFIEQAHARSFTAAVL
jgi:hypothetical protein